MNSTPSFFVYRAGAGSGKTFNLVREYLTMAFAGREEQQLQSQFRSILAITFTNKAANEMKERIVATLIALARGEGGSMGAALQEALRCDAAELQRRAQVVLSAVLHNYSDLSVCTIDSFMRRLVKTFARELQLPLNVNIELDDKYISALLVERLMALVGSEGHEALTEVLCAYGSSQMAEGKSSNIESQLMETAQSLFTEEAAGYVQLLEKHSPQDFRHAHEQLQQENRAFLAACRHTAQEALAVCHRHGLEAGDFKGGNNSSTYKWLTLMAEEKYFKADKSFNLYTSALKAHETGDIGTKKEAPRDVEEAVGRCIAGAVEGLPRYTTRRKLMGCYYNLAVMGRLQQLREDYYSDNELTDLTEISHKINAVVQESPVPYLYERLGDRYRHFLIDEFQDTSQEQWSNLLPLLLNGVAAGRRSLIVGDAKQAIYRFRQGDVRQFLALARMGESHTLATNESDAELHMLAQSSHTVPLATNYRTRPAVVRFNNRFFAWLLRNHYGDNALLQEIYPHADALLQHGAEGAPDSFGQLVPDGRTGGCVQLAFYHKADAKQKAPDQDTEEDDPLYATAYALIEQQRALGYALGDITVLADTNKTLSAFSAYLAARGLRSASAESMLLATSAVVRLFVALMHHLLQPDERLHQLQVLHHMRRLGMVPDSYTEPFYRHTTAPDGTVRYAFSLQDYLHTQGIDLDIRRLQRLPLYELCEELLRRLPVGERDSLFVASLLNFVAAYSATHRQSPGEFLDYFERKLEKLSSHTPADSRAVQLMTVHKSKGLEAPVVVYLLPRPHSQSSPLWIKTDDEALSPIDVALVTLGKEESTLFDDRRDTERHETEMDNVNRTYVAFTRPKDKLLLVVDDVQPNGAKTPPPDLLNSHLYQYALECADSGLCHKETERDLFLFGSDHPKADTDKQADDDGQPRLLSRLSYPTWRDRILVAPSASAPLAPATQESIHRGVELHDLLAHIHRADDLDAALRHHARVHACRDDHMATLRHAVEQLLHHPETAPFFATANEVKTECTLCHRGQVLRPDRLVLHDEETWVVDFKTGAPLATHADQVSSYCHAMTAMGRPNVQGFLIYLGGEAPQVVKVP